jgi:hypothetical protein
MAERVSLKLNRSWVPSFSVGHRNYHEAIEEIICFLPDMIFSAPEAGRGSVVDAGSLLSA